MANYGIKINLLKLKGAFLTNLKGKAETKRCLVVPVDECDGIFVGEKGCYLDMTAVALKEPRYADTHFVKVNLSQARRSAMSDMERDAVPIIGGLRVFDPKLPPREPNGANIAASGPDDFAPKDEDLPF